MEYLDLVEKSIEAQNYSYSIYSKIRVGAALLTKTGKVYTGCNVENSSFGATVCAEQVAVFKAVSEGEKEFEAIAITSNLEGDPNPCGICRQVLSEFSKDLKIILYNEKSGMKIKYLAQLLPDMFKYEEKD